MRLNKKPLSLRRFILATIGAAFVLCVIIFINVFIGNVTKILGRAEREHLSELNGTIHGTINSTLENMHLSTYLWSSWDETYDFVLGKNDNFIDENLADGSLIALYKADFAVIKDIDGSDVYTGVRSADMDGVIPVLPDELTGHLSEIAAGVLRDQTEGKSDLQSDGPCFDSGLIVVEGKSYLACVMPVLKTDDSGEPAGTFSFVAEFGNNEIRELTSLDTTAFYVIEQAEDALPLDDDFTIKDKNTVTAATAVTSLGNGRSVLLIYDHPRMLYANSISLVTVTTITLSLAILAMMIIIFCILEFYILRPFDIFISDLAGVRQDVSLDTEKYSRYQEFSALSQTINDTLSRLEQSYADAEKSKSSINVLKSILNGMDAYLYVSDPKTDEMLFINDKMREHFKIDGDCLGNTCWKVLQDGFSERCDFCPCYELEKNPSGTVIWEERNTLTGRYYRNTDRLIDWVDGCKTHLQHSVDITDIKMAELALKERLEQQAMMTAISQNFIMNEDLDTLIARALEMTGEFMGVELLMLCRYNSGNASFICVNEWSNLPKGAVSEEGGVIKLSASDMPVLEKLKNGDISFVSSEDLSVQRRLSRLFPGITTMRMAPVFVSGSLWGVLNFGEADEGSMWTQNDTDLAHLVASVLSGVLSRRGMESQLRMLSSIVESSPQYISYLKPDGEISYVNPAAADITGYSEEELLAEGMGLIYSQADIEHVRDEIIPEILEKGKASFEMELLRKDGDKRIMSFSGFITGAPDNSVGGIASDITEMRKLERELVAAKELAEEGSRAKSEFLSRMSHEMRTPMNAIIGMTSIAHGAQDAHKKEYCLEKIDNASRHLLGVINDILDMSKIEANKFELSCSEFTFDKMVMNVVNVINFRMEEKKQKFTLYIDPAIPAAIVSDEQRLAQVITNLLTNAVKFTPDKGNINLFARVKEERRDELTLQIEVQDDGIGISEEQQRKLFRTFEQADGSIARKFGGTGLGLAISKRIVELMGGDIWIESEYGSGSKFLFTMEAKRGETRGIENIKRQIVKCDMSILAVDDSTETLDYFSYVMQELGISCEVATGGKEALEIINARRENPFDIIFIDWKMPEMNGIELARELRGSSDNHSIIIMISVAEWNDIQEEAKDAGINGFMPKPLYPSLLVDCINKYLNPAVNIELKQEKVVDKKHYSGKIALLAEDVDINREIVLTILEDTELRIDCAKNGVEAVKMFGENPERYDIIFMDVHMPEMDGLEATRRIRSMNADKAKAIPIIAMTANVFREDIASCLDAGMDDHIGKPINFDELFDKLGKYI